MTAGAHSASQCARRQEPSAANESLTPEDLRVIVELFEIFYRWDEEQAKANNPGSEDVGVGSAE